MRNRRGLPLTPFYPFYFGYPYGPRWPYQYGRGYGRPGCRGECGGRRRPL